MFANAAVTRSSSAAITAVTSPPWLAPITITGSDYDVIEWITSGDVISVENSLDIGEFADLITHNYVRAQLKSNYGIAFTQPFGIFETEHQVEEITQPVETPQEPDDKVTEEETYEIVEDDSTDEDNNLLTISDLLSKNEYLIAIITLLPLIAIVLAIWIIRKSKL